MKINIVGGSGIMGSVHSQVFESLGHEVIISGRNSNPSIEESSINSDVTIISVPITAVEEVIKRVAPHCKALLDFTSVKTKPLKLMLEYSNRECEVAGLHPLYGPVSSIKGRTIIYCKTEKSGKTCDYIVEELKKAGANIKEMTAEKHDLIVSAVTQNARTLLLESLGLLMQNTGLKAKEIYEISPPPTKILIDLLARQLNEKNDSMYESMREHNPYTNKVRKELLGFIKSKNKDKESILRSFFAEELEKAQERAKKAINVD